LKKKLQFNGYFLIGILGLFGILILVYFLDQIYRNCTKTDGSAIAEKEKVTNTVRIFFILCKPWKVRADQYIYLRISGVRFYSFAESYPINIFWWKENTANRQLSCIILFTEIQSGFTRYLVFYKYSSLRVFIDSLYGNTKNIEYYNSFLFVCTGIGITVQFFYIKKLIAKQRNSYCLKKILFI